MTKDQRPKTKDQRPKTKDQRPKTKDQRPKTEDQRSCATMPWWIVVMLRTEDGIVEEKEWTDRARRTDRSHTPSVPLSATVIHIADGEAQKFEHTPAFDVVRATGVPRANFSLSGHKVCLQFNSSARSVAGAEMSGVALT